MWVLLLLAVHINNPNDIPGRVMIEFQTQAECLKAESTVKYALKFDSFKVITKCEKQS
jgi:hypothetical protein